MNYKDDIQVIEMKEGRIRTIKEICKRKTCEVCGEPATHKLTFLLPNARINPASSAHGGDDVSWCSDKARFVCDIHKKDRYKIAEELGMEWCADYPFERFEHMFLYWKAIVDSATKNEFTQCPYCGSTDIEEIEDGIWYCNYCWEKWDDEGLKEDSTDA